jgi:hypothetical protein
MPLDVGGVAKKIGLVTSGEQSSAERGVDHHNRDVNKHGITNPLTPIARLFGVWI